MMSQHAHTADAHDVHAPEQQTLARQTRAGPVRFAHTPSAETHPLFAGGGLSLEPLTPVIGALIGGVDLRKPLAPETQDAIRAALLDYKVIFFRDQDITTEQHLAFARCFGELEVHPFAPHKEGHPEILAITHNADRPGQENVWHSDVTWREAPSLGSVLRGLEMPAIGGDTLFSDMYAAYDGLGDDVKERLDGLVAVHDFAPFRQSMVAQGLPEEKIAEFDRTYPAVEHPVVRTHPETGLKGLYVNAPFTRRIKGMDEGESSRLLRHLYAQAVRPEYQCRFHWENNSIAFWDNRACQHYAASDYWPARRRVERATIIGDKPFA